MTENEDPAGDGRKGTTEATPYARRAVTGWAVFRSVFDAIAAFLVLFGTAGVLLALFHPETPLPRQWNPVTPLVVADPVTPLTLWKLRRTVSDPTECRSTLDAAAQISTLPPQTEVETCTIPNRISVSAVGASRLDPVETACATALRLAMWERHGVQPAARVILGSEARVIRHIGSYNCRRIRTSQGAGNRWSTHATAEAIDVTGFDLADGRRIRLLQDWDGSGPEARFLRAVRDSACTWFATTLGPDYNALHADHFHLQSRGWGLCR